MDRLIYSKPMEFKGHAYQVAFIQTFDGHPSWYTFEDEACVRDRDWSSIRPGDKILDVGAAYGSYALTALLQGADLVYAWSPQSQPGDFLSEADLFEQSLELNGWSGKCNVIRSGVYNRTGWLNTMTQEFFTEEPLPNLDVIKVSKLDDWFETVKENLLNSRIWLKLDVEGAEVEVLNGATNLLNQVKPIGILVENHEFKRATIADEVSQLLTSFGYKEISRIQHYSVSHSLYLLQ